MTIRSNRDRNSAKIPKPRPGRKEYLSRRALSIAMETRSRWPDYIPRVETTRLLAADGINISMFRAARRLALSGRDDLVKMVLDGEMSLFRAHETVTMGERIVCPTCNGRSYIFGDTKS